MPRTDALLSILSGYIHCTFGLDMVVIPTEITLLRVIQKSPAQQITLLKVGKSLECTDEEIRYRWPSLASTQTSVSC